MYLRQTTRKNKDGSTVTYVQLAHNQRKGASGEAVAEVLYNFGRKDTLDVEALQRLVSSVQRFLGSDTSAAPAAPQAEGGAELRIVESRRLGGAFLLHQLWKKLGIDRALTSVARSQSLRVDPVPLIFAMVANRALDPGSKHSIPEWAAHDVVLPGVSDLTDDQLYRAMDFLIAADAKVQEAVFFEAADLLNLKVDLLLYDTTSSYFEMEDDDVARADRLRAWEAFDRGEGPEPLSARPQVVNEPPLRMKGHSKDHRPDLAQIVIGMAVTREGIPVRCWTWPGNTSDMTTVATVKADLRGWKLNRVVWAVDRGFVSAENLIELQKGGAHYIAGRKLRSGEKDVEEALARPGRYRKVADNLEVKEIVVGEGEARRRMVLVRNPHEIARDREQRERALATIRERLAALPPDQDAHTKAVCELRAHRTLGRYLKSGKKGLPVIDHEKVRDEERLDGKYLLLTSDDTLDAGDVALGYKQLAEVERAWRTLKSELDIRPMYHRLDARIRAHVLLCWLALLLIRITEVETEKTWAQVRADVDRIHRVVWKGRHGCVAQCTEVTDTQAILFRNVGVAPPARFQQLEPAST